MARRAAAVQLVESRLLHIFLRICATRQHCRAALSREKAFGELCSETRRVTKLVQCLHRRVSEHMAPGEDADCLLDTQLLALPLHICSIVAQALPQEDLPSLRLVSRAWCDAASRAVRHLGKGVNSVLRLAQREHLQIAAHKFPGLSTVNMIYAHRSMPRQLQYLESLLSLTSLRSISLLYTATREAVAWEVLQQQACLTSLWFVSWDPAGAGLEDTILHRLISLQN